MKIMKTAQKYRLLICGGVALTALAANLVRSAAAAGGNSGSDPCVWGQGQKVFTSTALSISVKDFLPATVTATFRTTLTWQEKSYTNAQNQHMICSLKEPTFSSDPSGTPALGGVCKIEMSDSFDTAKKFDFYFEIEGYNGADKMTIDTSKADGTQYVAAFPTRLATTDAGNGRTTNWTWGPAAPDTRRFTPTSVKITGAEGRQIKIQHGSPAVLLRKVIDKQTNSIVSVTWNATNSVSHLLDMQHTVDANQ